MNTPAISTTLPSSVTSLSKATPSETGAAEQGFHQMLSRGIAERRAATNTSTAAVKDPAKQASAETAATQKSSEEDAKTDAANGTASVTTTPTAEQLLFMAAQFPQPVSTNQSANADTTAALQPNPVGAAQTAISVVRDATTDLPQNIQETVLASAANRSTTAQAEVPTAAGNGNEASPVKTFNEKLAAETSLQDTKSAQTAATHTSSSELENSLLVSTNSSLTTDPHNDKTPEMRSDLSAALSPLQQTTLTHATAAAGAAERITPQIGTNAWNHAIGQKVVWMIGNEQQSASLTLNPPDLGPLQVVLSVSSTQANAQFYASQPEVRQALEAALPKLREMLGDAGIQLGQANVNTGTPQHQGGYASGQSSAPSAPPSTTYSTEAVAVTSAPTIRIVREGLVDTFA